MNESIPEMSLTVIPDGASLFDMDAGFVAGLKIMLFPAR